MHILFSPVTSLDSSHPAGVLPLHSVLVLFLFVPKGRRIQSRVSTLGTGPALSIKLALIGLKPQAESCTPSGAIERSKFFARMSQNADRNSDRSQIVKGDRAFHRADPDTTVTGRITGIMRVVNPEGRVHTQTHKVGQRHMIGRIWNKVLL
jgi:hypothetical protein